MRRVFSLRSLRLRFVIILRPKVVYHLIVQFMKTHLQNYNIQEMQTLKEKLDKLQLGKDPYQLLQCSPTSDFAEVKKSFRILALKYHPDRNKEEEATHIFIKISRAYEFLSEEENRKLYADHIKSIEEQRQKIQAMGSQRRNLIQNLKRREEEFLQRKRDQAAQLKRRKDFFEKMEKEQEEKQTLRSTILNQMNPKQFYERLSSIEVSWQSGLSFTSKMLQNYFKDWSEVIKVVLQQKRRKATVVLSSIQKTPKVVEEFNHPLVQVQLKVKGSERQRLLGALQRRKTGGDFSLSTENIQRLKEMMNRESSLYLKGYKV